MTRTSCIATSSRATYSSRQTIDAKLADFGIATFADAGSHGDGRGRRDGRLSRARARAVARGRLSGPTSIPWGSSPTRRSRAGARSSSRHRSRSRTRSRRATRPRWALHDPTWPPNCARLSPVRCRSIRTPASRARTSSLDISMPPAYARRRRPMACRRRLRSSLPAEHRTHATEVMHAPVDVPRDGDRASRAARAAPSRGARGHARVGAGNRHRDRGDTR